ncbi:Peptidyl-prolyl cis-trans isomerase D [Kingella potus]|uniref:Periplasmic chaperone PpiD n=1 Tax=Kingella potus TaxID=265175 RepID=A0A377QY33_9NEIS|nr:SurA N-terminal domain-containing protein [Kingella potus]UOP01390.1 SurA N-terminal domain-containing protein [Kingella potus]STR00294.1 Peptidyl-prolyl cis-trans isomerase D [Kingella potus]
MFATVEKYSGPAKIMLGLIALTFVGFGAGGLIAAGSDYIVKVGGEKISTQKVQEAQREQNLGSSQNALSVLIERAYLTEGAQMMGIGVSEAQLKQVIVDDPGFHDENGRFSEAKFRQFLQQGGLSEEHFLENLRNSFALQNLVNLAGSGNIVSSSQAGQYAQLMLADRQIRSVVFDPKTFAAQIQADDAALKAYYDKDKSKYRLPQAVKYQYIELSPRTLAESQSISEEELAKAFAEQQKNASPTREVAHIMLKTGSDAAKTKAEAEKILAEAKAAPDSFAALAEKYSQDEGTAHSGGSLGAVGKNSPLPEAFKTAVSALGQGETALVESEGAFHIVRIGNVRNGLSFDEAKPALEAALKEKKAREAAAKVRDILRRTAFEKPDSLQPSAEAAGLAVRDGADWLSRENAQQAGLPAEAVEALFGDDVFKKKHNSDLITVGDTSWVLRATETRAESVPPFEQAKEQVRSAFLNSESAKAAEAQGKKLLAELQKGGTPQLDWSPVETLTAADARLRLPPQALSALAKARPAEGKPAYLLLEGLPTPLLMEVQSVKVPQTSAEDGKLIRTRLAEHTAIGMYNGLLDYLKGKIPIEQGKQKTDGEGH